MRFSKKSSAISEKDINKAYNDLLASCERDLKKLKTVLENQKNKDEQERLKKIQVRLYWCAFIYRNEPRIWYMVSALGFWRLYQCFEGP